jgi:predicted RNA-binding Zn-ribbon protein involved in translation (DUF1610 family)
MQPKPEMVPCVACGADTEIWSDEAEGKCPACGAAVVRYASQSCVDWCRYARECLGDDKYKQYGQMKAAMRKHALFNALEQYFAKGDERVKHSRKVVGYAELILAEESTADPNVVFAAAILLATGGKSTPAGQGSAPADAESEGPSVAREILKTLGYAEDFISEVCDIIENKNSVREKIDFKIVCDAALLANSEETLVRDAAGSSNDSFLQLFMTRGGRKIAERGVALSTRSLSF